MQIRFVLSTVMVAFCVVLTGCQLSRSFEGQGRIVGFGSDGQTVFIDHEDIEGFMPAMAMPFSVQDSKTLAPFEMGDAIAFTLVVTKQTAWVENLKSIPETQLNLLQDDVSASSSLLPLAQGETMPDLRLLNQDGNAFQFSDFDNQYLLVTFIYTRCPIPDYCPLMSRQFQKLQPELKDTFGDQIHLISISFDVDYDTPKILNDYASRYTRDLSTWTFATGSPQEIADATTLLGVTYTAEEAIFDHNLTTALLSPNRRILKFWRGNDWTTQDVLEEVKTYLSPTTSSASTD